MKENATSHLITLRSELLDLSDDALADVVATELNERAYELKLDEPYCMNGGSIGGIHIEELELTEEKKRFMRYGTFEISFEESWSGGCRDIHWRECWRGMAEFALELSTGDLSFDLEAKLVKGFATDE